MAGGGREIIVLAEVGEGGDPTVLTLELLGLARGLVSEQGMVTAVVLGSHLEGALDEIASRGADRVIYLEHPSLAPYNPEAWQAVLEPYLEEQGAGLILAGHTCLGQDLLPRLAFSLEAGVVTDCVGIRAGEDSFLFTKPVYGGNALATMRVTTPLALATVRSRVGEVLPPSSPGGELVPLPADPPAVTRMVVRERRSLEAGECPLEEAKVVVSGGRGMGGREGFEMLRELARLLGGAVGASRPPVDSGWAPATCQVGITGKVVAPELYIAVAISGSSQHLSGMCDSGKVVAINKDPEAYIFKVSDYGVVGDWKEVLPAFISRLRELV
jgi:electron transfer flavoprotein alpha subunit